MTLDPASYSPEHFRWEFTDGVATITLDRPDKKNPLTFESYHELQETFSLLSDIPQQVKAVVITGAGGNFCSGGDVHEIIGPLTRMGPDGWRQFTKLTGDLVWQMRMSLPPIIAAVQGVCAGAGAILAMASDIRFATPDAKTAFLFARVGLSGADMGACAILPRIIGQGRASELLFSGRNMTAEEGLAWGFWNGITDDVLEHAQALARQLASGPTVGHVYTKRQLNEEWNVTLREALDMEAEAQAICMGTNDFKRAYEAFVAKRKPEFKGD